MTPRPNLRANDFHRCLPLRAAVLCMLGLSTGWVAACSSGASSGGVRPGQVGAIDSTRGQAGARAESPVLAADGNRPGLVSSAGQGGMKAALANAGSSAAAGASSAPPDPSPVIIDKIGSDNAAGLSPAEVTQLVAGGAPAAMSWLYPYDGTVFPSGTLASLVMWTGNAAPDAVYLHMKSRAFEYKGIHKPALDRALFMPSNASFAGTFINGEGGTPPEANKQLAIPQEVWDAAGQHTSGKGDPFLIEITERVNGQIHGPISAHITIARGALQGSIYYNSCFAGTSTTSGNGGLGFGIQSRVLRIPPRGNAEIISNTSQCIGCHSVAANGSRLVAQRAQDTADLGSLLMGQSVVSVWSAQLSPDGKLDTNQVTSWGTMGSFGALYPDGSKYLAAAGNAGLEMDANLVKPLSAASLFDAITGAVVADTGITPTASMPNFSPDGTRLVFNDTRIGTSHGLAVMDYDTRNHKASGYQVLLQDDPMGNLRPGWPFFVPDNHAVVFVQTASPDFTTGESHGNTAALLMQDATYPSDLYIADMATGKQTILAKAMGFNTPDDAAASKTYLAYGKEQLHRNSFPTVSPVASGGYFWIFFDSLRYFGSIGARHALWGAAIDIHPDGSYTSDPSHPAFYVPGQEFINSSHHRAFAALDACKPDGNDCTTGVDCCGGRCTGGKCSQPPPDDRKTCASRDERCATAADCCDAADYCINNFCALVELL